MNRLAFSSHLILVLVVPVLAQRGGGIPDRPVLFPGDGGSTFCQGPGGQASVCETPSNCVTQFRSPVDFTLPSCRRAGGELGVCCPLSTATQQSSRGFTSTQSVRVQEERTSSQTFSSTEQFKESRNQFVPMPDITTNDINDSGLDGMDHLRKIIQLEQELTRRGLTVKPGTTESFHQAFFGNKEIARQLGKDGQVALEIAIELLKRFKLDPIQGRDGLVKFDLTNTNIKQICPGRIMCPNRKYRSMDGSCNNLENPEWGKSFTPFQRFMLPRYPDGVNLPRIASDGGPLPSPRRVSMMSNPDADFPHNHFTLIVMQWAQFLDHDMTVASISRANNGEGIKCCDEEIRRNPRLRHPECLEIPIPVDDPFFAKFGQTCMEFVRSAPAPRESCTLGPREQMNQLTAFLDGSQIYGSTTEESQKLRSFRGGRLRVLRFNNADLLPREETGSEECADRRTDSFCFMAGDARVNEQNGLTTMHTLWMREHNRVAGYLQMIHPEWSDEVVFQEARRIVVAELQHITYDEFLPILLGRKMMRSFGLLLQNSGHSHAYDPKANPSIANGFATAAYRYGHTLVQGNVKLMEEDGSVVMEIPLHTQFFNPVLIYGPRNFDRMLRGLTQQPAQTFDRFVTVQLTNHLFEIPGHGFGLDLIALNIQRGRDHGLPPYNAWREHCGLKKMTSFGDLNQVMNEQSASMFSMLYRSVDDIDLFAGGIAERSLPDATLGPTLACIVSEQFRRLKVGDRFFYENGGMATSFTEAQLSQLKNANLARIICDNSDNIRMLQPTVFVQPNGRWNPQVNCSGTYIPSVNLDAWISENSF